MNQVKDRQPRNSNETNGNIKNILLLPCKGEKWSTITKTLSKELRRTLHENIKMEVIYTVTKLESQFTVKDPILKRHNHNIIYHIVHPEDNSNEDYIGEFENKKTQLRNKI